MKLIALIGDIVRSREIENRDEFQKKLENQLRSVNREGLHLLSPYTLTLGDEFQAVYAKADRMFNDIWKIMMGLYPQKVRFALGVGTLTTPVNSKRAIGMDGPAFHYARTGITRLKETSYLIKIEAEDVPHLDLLNNSLYLTSQAVSGWSLNRFQVLSGLLSGQSRKKIADSLGISTVAVYKNIRAGSLDVIIDLSKEIGNALNEVLG
jgi:hypothetical protein